MNLPFFYIDKFETGIPTLELPEESSRHIVQVLRMKPGEKINLTDGRGQLITAAILEDHKKHCRVKVETTHYASRNPPEISIGISLVKNTNRFEWFLEKATEIGVSRIIPMLCERTEKEKFREERLKGIIVSAMLQSQQAWLPELFPPQPFEKILAQQPAANRFIAYCGEGVKKTLTGQTTGASSLLLIGPEGDFTPGEFEKATREGFIPVTLGTTRLRTETAGLVGATLLKSVKF